MEQDDTEPQESTASLSSISVMYQLQALKNQNISDFYTKAIALWLSNPRVGNP